ncbi:hypothetical protein LEP1GSC019_3234 [Leptospira interrogans serovar Pyrogenes str. 2006006960]|nr:hypothetical protein LEP1GSC019_3234 [Leptospira interrogans serovar Pyrogenes str. 2006006960]
MNWLENFGIFHNKPFYSESFPHVENRLVNRQENYWDGYSFKMWELLQI